MKTILKLNLSVLISIIVLFMITISCAAAISPENGENESVVLDYKSNDNSSELQLSTAPLNPAFIQYQEELEQSRSTVPTNTNMVVPSGFT